MSADNLQFVKSCAWAAISAFLRARMARSWSRN